MVFHVKPVDNFVEERLRRITFNKSMGNRFKSFTIKAIVYICIRMLLLCLSMLLCMYSYVSRMYLYVTRMYLYVTRMYLYVTCMYCMLLECVRMLLVCTRNNVTRMLLVVPVCSFRNDPS